MLIGDVARRCGLSARMLRHYDSLGLVTPTGRTSGGYREYTDADLRRLFEVESLRSLGLSLEDAKRALDDPEFEPAALVDALIDQTRVRISAQQQMVDRLEAIAAAGPTQWVDVLDTVGLLRGLASGVGSARQQAVLTRGSGDATPVAELVAAVLAEADLNVAGALRWALARAGDDAVPLLGAGLASTDPVIRRRAILALATVRTPGATRLLRTAQTDDDDEIRDRVTLELGRRADGGAVDGLVTMIVDGRCDVEAAEVLGSLVVGGAALADRVVDAMSAALTSGTEPVRLRLTQALAEVPGPSSEELLDALAGDDDKIVAATAQAIRRG